MTDLIKQKIIELVPEIAKRPSVLTFHGKKEIGAPDNIGPRITLADVLRAIQKTDAYEHFDIEMLSGAVAFKYDKGGRTYQKWNLTADFDGQPPEVKAFIGELLGVKKLD